MTTLEHLDAAYSFSDMRTDLHNTYVQFKDEGHVTYSAHLVAMTVLFVTFTPITPELFVMEASNFTHMCICVLCIYYPII